MPSKRLTFTIDEDTYREITDRLAGSESVDEWVRDAIDDRLKPEDDEDEREPLEFVDDCAI